MANPWWSAEPPWTHEVTEAKASEVLQANVPAGAAVFELDGSAMRSHDDLFQEFAVKLSFPDYFGNNWPALQDCLDDMTWLPPTGHYLLIIHDWPTVLSECEVDRPVLRRILNDVGSMRAKFGLGPGSEFESIAFNSLLVT